MAGAKVKNVSMEEISKEVTKMPTPASCNIFQRMLRAQTMIETVSKNLEVSTGQRLYKAVSERDILDAVKKIENECGIYSYPQSREILELKETTNKNGIVSFWVRLEVTYRFVNVDNPSEYIEVKSYGDGIDTMDKAPGKSMTYADKYALMKAYKISTGDDPDKDASVEQTEICNKQKKPVNKTYKAEERPPVEKPKGEVSGALLMEFKECQTKLSDLKVDIHSESIMQWMADHTGYGDQSIEMDNPDKLYAMVKAYKVLIKAKEAKLAQVGQDADTEKV